MIASSHLAAAEQALLGHECSLRLVAMEGDLALEVGQTKLAQSQHAVVAKNHIVRPYVAVHNAALMHHRHGSHLRVALDMDRLRGGKKTRKTNQLSKCEPDHGDAVDALLFDHGGQGAALGVLLHEHDAVARAAEAVTKR